MARACGTTNQYPVARGTASEESVSFSSQQACERQEFLSYVQLGTFMYEYGACGISLRNYSTASPSRLVDAMVQFEYNSHHHTMHAPSSTFWKRIHHNYHKLLLTIQHGAASRVRRSQHYNLPQSDPAAPADHFRPKCSHDPSNRPARNSSRIVPENHPWRQLTTEKGFEVPVPHLSAPGLENSPEP